LGYILELDKINVKSAMTSSFQFFANVVDLMLKKSWIELDAMIVRS